MAQKLNALTAPPKDMSSVSPSMLGRSQLLLTPVPGNLSPSLGPHRPLYTQIHIIHMNKKINIKDPENSKVRFIETQKVSNSEVSGSP